MRNVARSPLLLRVMARIGDASFKEEYIPRESGRDIYGLQLGNEITVNPLPHVVDTVIHEILHALFPAYSEQAIRSLTGKLCKRLSNDEIQTIYEEYRKRVNLSPRLEAAEQERQSKDEDF